MRKIDEIASHTYSRLHKSAAFISKKKIKTLQGVAIILFFAGIVGGFSIIYSLNIQTSSNAGTDVFNKSPLMEIIKSKGCVADGLLSGYGGDTEKAINMINHSECQYLHRALETWAAPPDFNQAKRIKNLIKKKDVLLGMFLAEAINIKSEFRDPATNKKFDFKSMCRPDSLGFWAKDLCKAYLPNDEYRQYLRFITQEAIDMGIQSFMFGQIHFQDDLKNPAAPAIVREMRQYAASQGKQVVIGAQTNTISNASYLKIFDYIEGGVGLENSGKIEKGACSERWLKDGWCWALVWNKKYSEKANDVLVHFDWSGMQVDDLSTFARMDKQARKQILTDMHIFFTNRNVGFLFPLMGTLYNQNGGCYGSSKDFYSASRDYSCQDEEAINEIIRNAAPKEDNLEPTIEEPAMPIPETEELTEPTPETTVPTTPETTIPAPETITPATEAPETTTTEPPTQPAE